MDNGVTIKYSKYDNNPITESAELELVKDIVLKLKYDVEQNNVKISMADTITDNTQLEGTLDYDKLSAFIRVLSQLNNQIKNNNEN